MTPFLSYYAIYAHTGLTAVLTIILILALIMAVGSTPHPYYGPRYNYWPFGTIVLVILLIILLGGCSNANAGQSPPEPTLQSAEDFAQSVAKAGNFSIAVSPGYAPKLGNGEWGLAVVGGYQHNQYVGAYVRADLFDNNYTVASGSLTAQYPIHFGKNVTIAPFAEAGLGSTLGGGGDKNKDVFAIAGGGFAAEFWKSNDGSQSLAALFAVETWEPVYHGVSIYRVAVAYTVHFGAK